MRALAAERIVDAAKPGIVSRLTAEIEADLIASTNAKAAKILEDAHIEAAQFQEEMLAQVDEKVATHQKEQTSLAAGRLRTEEERARALLDDIKNTTSETQGQFDALQSEIALTRAEIDAAKQKKAELLSELEQLASAKSSLKQSAAPALRLHQNPEIRELVAQLDAEPWRANLDAIPLLTPNGRLQVAKFAALILAGEVPVVTGTEAHDFLTLAAFIICGGSAVTMAVDPTIITVDDLWLRAGSGALTALGLALAEILADSNAQPVLAIIKEPEQSAARHWMPALADLARSAAFARKFLPCVLADQKTHELGEASKSCIWLKVDHAFDQNALPLAPLFYSVNSDRKSVLKLDSVFDPAQAAQDLTALGHQSIDAGIRGLRVQSLSRQIMEDDDAQRFAKDFITAISRE